jgi:hypothetical protein
MSDYTLSVVQLCPATHSDAAEAVAEAAGYGPGGLSVQLVHTDGSTWRGCHAWWIPEVLAAKSAPTGDPAIDDVLAQVVTSVVDTAGMSDAELSEVALQHWQAALAANGLTVVTPAE